MRKVYVPRRTKERIQRLGFYVLLLFFTCVLPVGSEGINHPESESPVLRVLSYNVMRHNTGVADWIISRIRGESSASERMTSAIVLLMHQNAGLIALQEVTLPFLKVLHERFSGYHLATTLKITQKDLADIVYPQDGLVILSRWAFTRIENKPLISSQLGRRMLVVSVKVGKHQLTVATCHLDSIPESGRTRNRQLRAFFESLATADNAILLGDFNFGDGEQPETAALRKDYRDVWLTLHPKDPGITYDVQQNTLAFVNKFSNEPSRRLDRILLRTPNWEPADIRRFGMRPIAIEAKKQHISDHYGLVVTLRPNRKIERFLLRSN